MDTAESQKDSFIRRLQEWDAQAVAEVIEFRGETTIVVPREHLRRAAEFLLSDPKLQFTFLSDITAVDKFPTRAALRAELSLAVARAPRAYPPESAPSGRRSRGPFRDADLAGGKLA